MKLSRQLTTGCALAGATLLLLGACSQDFNTNTAVNTKSNENAVQTPTTPEAAEVYDEWNNTIVRLRALIASEQRDSEREESVTAFFEAHKQAHHPRMEGWTIEEPVTCSTTLCSVKVTLPDTLGSPRLLKQILREGSMAEEWEWATSLPEDGDDSTVWLFLGKPGTPSSHFTRSQ